MNDAFRYRQKRNAALLGVLTLGLAGLSLMGAGNIWKSNIFSGTSLDYGGTGFVLKILSFMFLSALIAVPFFIKSINYVIKIMPMKHGVLELLC